MLCKGLHQPISTIGISNAVTQVLHEKPTVLATIDEPA